MSRPRKFSDKERRERKNAQAKLTRQVRHFKNKYGLTVEQRDEMLVAQGGRCAICKTADPNHRRGWFVDHAHGSNKIRGILCSSCNTGIAFLKDDPAICIAAATYLAERK